MSVNSSTAPYEPSRPAFTLLVAEPEQLDDWRRTEASKTAAEIVALEGGRAHSEPELFSALAKAFQFPSYFGGNWDATDEMLGDLSWLGDRNEWVLLVCQARELLEDEPQSRLKICVDVLGDAHGYWAGRVEDRRHQDKRGTFATVLQASPDEVETVVGRYEAVGVDLRGSTVDLSAS